MQRSWRQIVPTTARVTEQVESLMDDLSDLFRLSNSGDSVMDLFSLIYDGYTKQVITPQEARMLWKALRCEPAW